MLNRRDLVKGMAAGITAAAGTSIATAQLAMTPGSVVAKWTPVFPGIWKATIGTPEAYTPMSSRVIQPDNAALNTLEPPLATQMLTVEGEITPRGTVVRLPLAPHEQIYGFGLQLLSFPQRGKKKTIRVNADPRLDTGDSHAPVPFYVSTSGYGIFVDTCRHADFYCGDARLRPTHSESTTTTAVNNSESTRTLPPDAAGVVTIEVPRAIGVTVYLFGGPTMLDAVQRYNLFSGGGVNPPEWGLGFWYRADGHATQEDVLTLAREFRERKIPCDVLGLEPGWQTHAYSCSFKWDNGRFPDPAGMIGDLGKQGFQVNLWEHAFTHPTSPLFESLQPHTANYGVWGGLVPDFAGEPARRIFGEYHGKQLIDLGIAGFKLDECDGSDYTGGWSYPDLATFPSGIDGEQMHAVFGLRYQDTIWKQFRDRKKKTYSLVRSSGSLAAPYPFVLYSDLYGHRDFVRGIVNASFSGLLWCPEVRDAVSEEDLIRRLETVVFSPLAMVNAWYIKNPPWKQIDRDKNNANELSQNWQALEGRCREIIGWRMQIVPYLRAAFSRYAKDGTPPFRALVLDHPGQENLRTVDDEYMMGDRMIAAPLFAGEATRRVILPEGNWHDFWTGKAVTNDFTLASSTRNIPVFVKAGSVLPLAKVSASAATQESRELIVQVYGEGSLPFTLSTDDAQLGLTWAARKGSERSSGKRPYRVTDWKVV